MIYAMTNTERLMAEIDEVSVDLKTEPGHL